MKTKLILILSLVIANTTFAQHDHASHSNDKKPEASTVIFNDAKLGSAYENYILLKETLVASKSDDAKKAATELQKSLATVSNSQKVSGEVTKFLAASDLAAQRKIFSSLSNEMTSLVKGGQLSGGMLYLEYCPMANNNEGAYWLSNEKEIKNPYFGDMMLRCGSVKETIQ